MKIIRSSLNFVAILGIGTAILVPILVIILIPVPPEPTYTLFFSLLSNISNNEGQLSSAHIATSGNNVYVIWQGDTTNSSDIYFASSKDNGNTFGKIVNLSYSSTGRSSPQIADIWK